jgi:hypothetical protein
MLSLQLPKDALPADAAVFTQAGEFVSSGHREQCEADAEAIGGLYCWVDNGRAVIRHDFERAE